MNFTLDDNASQLSYLPDAWGVQADDDPALSSFFGRTYHAAQVDGASVNMSVGGTDVYLWGSKGPRHGNFSVQYDDKIIFLSASAPTTQYQQLLFHASFATSSVHFVSLKAQLDDENNWLDLDYITVTTPDSSSPSRAIPPLTDAVLPPWQSLAGSSSEATTPPRVSTSSESFVVPSTTPLATPTSAPQHTNRQVFALAIAFGALLGIALLFGACYYALVKVSNKRRAREHAFRQGVRKTPGPAGPDKVEVAGGESKAAECYPITRLAPWTTTNASHSSLSPQSHIHTHTHTHKHTISLTVPRAQDGSISTASASGSSEPSEPSLLSSDPLLPPQPVPLLPPLPFYTARPPGSGSGTPPPPPKLPPLGVPLPPPPMSGSIRRPLPPLPLPLTRAPSPTPAPAQANEVPPTTTTTKTATRRTGRVSAFLWRHKGDADSCKTDFLQV